MCALGNLGEKRQPIRILIADDQPVFRCGLRALLQGEADLQIVGEATDCAEAARLVDNLGPHILLIDLATQGALGAQILQRIARSHPDLRIILLLAADAEKQPIIDALQLGVHGVVTTRASRETFVKSIRMVMAGEYWIPRGTIADFVRALRAVPVDPAQKQSVLKLTPRELEVVIAVAGGYTNKDIAQRFSISDQTVKHHLTNIFDKLGVSNRLELVIIAIGRGLVPAT
jgi:DNA-binding NarL/FixJ family response regulator